MCYTVTMSKPKDAEFVSYVRLLRQQGKDIGKLDRIPDPENPHRRWVYAWQDQEEARAFAEELIEETGKAGWRVEETAALPSEGPFGPVLIQLAPRSEGLLVGVHPLSVAMIRAAYPDAKPLVKHVVVNIEAWRDFAKDNGNSNQLIQGILPPLTGLNMDELNELGYAIIEEDTKRTMAYHPPAGVAAAQVLTAPGGSSRAIVA